MRNSSEYIFSGERKKDKLYVWFSSIDVPVGKFEMFKTISAIEDGDVIFLNCKNNSYYIEGIPGLGNFAKSIQALKTLIAGYDSVMFLGNSMGAYGALLYGVLLEVNNIIAYAPELQLGVRGGKYNSESRRAGYHLYNINQLLNTYGVKGSIHIILGEKAYYDMVGVVSLPKMNNLHLYSIANAYHSVIGIFQQDIFSHIESVEKLERIKYSGFGSLINYPDIIAWLYSKSQAINVSDRDLQSDLEFYEANKPRLGYLNGYIAAMIANHCNLMGGADSLVEKLFRESIKYNQYDVESWSSMKKIAPAAWMDLSKKHSISSIKDDRLMTQLAYKKFYETIFK